MQIAVVVGNPRPRSRTFTIASLVAQAASARLGGTVSVEVDLADHTNEIFSWPSDEMSRLTEAVAGSDLLVIASPTYKATYTGLLKAFLDRYPNNGLSGVTAVPVMTGASELHGMSIEMGLRPVLVELGASVPTRGLYFVMSHMAQVEEVIDAWATENLRPGGLIAPLARTSSDPSGGQA